MNYAKIMFISMISELSKYKHPNLAIFKILSTHMLERYSEEEPGRLQSMGSLGVGHD